MQWNKLSLEGWRVRPLKTVYRPRRIVGLDTETVDGYCRVICDSDGRSLFVEDGESLLRFLCHKGYRKNTLLFFYNVDFDFAAILKWFPEVIAEIGGRQEATVGRYQLDWAPGKFFTVKTGKQNYFFADMLVFYKKSLNVASKKYLGLEKEPEDLIMKRMATEIGYFTENLDKVIRYCIQDARLVAKLARLLQNRVHKCLHIAPKRYISPASISRAYFRQDDHIPYWRDFDLKLHYWAVLAYRAGRFELAQRGSWSYLEEWDINSAYPCAIANLANPYRGRWSAVDEPSREAHYGLYKVRATIPDCNISPVWERLKTGLIIYPVGEWEGWLYRHTFWNLMDLTDVEVLKAVEMHADRPHFPFREKIHDIYANKCRAKDESEYMLWKLTGNSFYGCFITKVKTPDGYQKVNGWFFPLFAGDITDWCQAEVYNVGVDLGDDLVGFATDSCIATRKPALDASDELGGWDYASGGEGSLVASGLGWIGGKPKVRGLGGVSNIRDLIRSDPTKSEWKIGKERAVKIRQALLMTRKFTLADINRFITQFKTVKLNCDSKRIWERDFVDGNDFLTSNIRGKPLPAGDINWQEILGL